MTRDGGSCTSSSECTSSLYTSLCFVSNVSVCMYFFFKYLCIFNQVKMKKMKVHVSVAVEATCTRFYLLMSLYQNNILVTG